MDKWVLLLQADYRIQTNIPELEIIIKASDTVELFNIINNILFFQEKNNTLTISEQQLLKYTLYLKILSINYYLTVVFYKNMYQISKYNIQNIKKKL